MPLRIEEARGRAAIARLLDLPLRLHAGEPGYVPPLRPFVMHRLNPDNPFFREALLPGLDVFRRDREGEVARPGRPVRQNDATRERRGLLGGPLPE